MRIGIACKVIDNFGDAGFSLRLGRALAGQGHRVWLFHDNTETFQALYPVHTSASLILVCATGPEFCIDELPELDLLLEPFGTSSEQTQHRFDRALKNRFPDTPWLLIDYLSSERWVEDFHLTRSIDPVTGHCTTYFYPGFNSNTGGLIHCDYPQTPLNIEKPAPTKPLTLFVFAYPNAPLPDLVKACNQLHSQGKRTAIHVSSGKSLTQQLPGLKHVPFCAQADFDNMLAQHDVLFVRGEDSFIRAQLAGKPLVWQIYATEDEAHSDKLASFFSIYTEGMSAECSSALWACWASWNKLKGSIQFSETWLDIQAFWPELNQHAVQWRSRLVNGPELVKEVLTWRVQQSPTLQEKPDL